MKRPKKKGWDWKMLKPLSGGLVEENPTLQKLIDDLRVFVGDAEIDDIFTAFVAVLGMGLAIFPPTQIEEYGIEFADAVISYALFVRKTARGAGDDPAAP